MNLTCSVSIEYKCSQNQKGIVCASNNQLFVLNFRKIYKENNKENAPRGYQRAERKTLLIVR